MGSLYCSVAQYKTLNGITVATYDSIYATVLEAMSRLIDRYCGKIFVSNSIVETFDGNGDDTYFTLRRPVLSVTLLERDYNGDGTWTTVAAADYHVYDEKVVLDNYTTEGIFSSNYSKFSEGQKNWRITYNHGASATPAEIELACAMMATYWISNGTLTSFTGLSGERIGNYSYTVGGGLAVGAAASFMPPEVKAILNLHRTFRIGGRGRGG